MEQTYIDNHPFLLNYTLQNHRLDFEDAEDIVSEAWKIYLEKVGEVRKTREYLMGIIRNLVAQKYRNKSKFTRYMQDVYHKHQMQSHNIERHDNLIYEMENEDEILRIIPLDYHELYILYKKNDYQQRSLARLMGENENTVKSKLYDINSYLKVYQLIQQGVIISKYILNTKQKKNFRHFISILGKAEQLNNVDILHKYITTSVRKSMKLRYDIKKVSYIDFTYHKVDNCFAGNVQYANSYDILDLIQVRFRCEGNRIKIIKAPRKAKGCIKVSNELFDTELNFSDYNRKNRKELYAKTATERLQLFINKFHSFNILKNN